MLVDLVELSRKSFSNAIVRDETLAEVYLPSNLRNRLSSYLLNSNISISAHTSFSATNNNTPKNFAVIPNQFFRFAVELFDFSVEVEKYFNTIDLLRSKILSVKDDYSSVVKALKLSDELGVSESDLDKICKFMDPEDTTYRLGGKCIINHKEGIVSLRSSEDCFGSLLLTQVNLPNSSSSILGDMVFSLLKNKDLYSELITFFNKDSVSPSPVDLYLPKPFILLAGISGTGKTRFVRKQAEKSGSLDETYSLVSVRPDWHEPSDLLGYVSRLGKKGPVYVVGAALQFMVKAWKHIVDVTGVDIGKQTTFNRAQLGQITPFWLCLDEMNLAPVEQYFSDYLSVIETREWSIEGEEHTYQCEPLLKADVFSVLADEDGYGLTALRKDLALDDDSYDTLWEQFVENGISIPFNLIVAGTVNMDETTHGFSRKVIDRALTIDFGRFFPNDYKDFFSPTTKNKVLGFPIISSARHHDFSDVPADTNGQRSIEFLTAVNTLLKESPFELAFRALNELLLSIACFKPKDEQELQAVWDDFLMAKVLPRIEGDEDKLRTKDGGDNVLVQLESLLENQLSTIWHDVKRPDLLRTKINDSVLNIDCHSKAKLAWMRDQLKIKTFTSFWP